MLQRLPKLRPGRSTSPRGPWHPGQEVDINGFVCHAYWIYENSNPGTTLGRVLKRVLEDGQPSYRFNVQEAKLSAAVRGDGNVKRRLLYLEGELRRDR